MPEEWKFATTTHDPFSHGIFPHQIAALKDRVQPLELKDIPYENFAKSLDLFGDQSLVVVPLPGHTPGSLGMFVNLPNGKRYFLIGDAAWGVDAEGNPEPRSLLAELISDHDHTQARATRQKLRELIEHSNEVILIPTHDAEALRKIRN